VSPSFTANDLQRSIAFYRDVLGFVVGDEWRGESGVLQGCGNARLAVWCFYADIRTISPRAAIARRDWARGCTSTRHRISTRLASEIKERGGTLDEEPADMPWGQRIFTITDPDGSS
jgi:catechol 2,3-dioxygenase-like lactoylglutathione lyase family enzyme